MIKITFSKYTKLILLIQLTSWLSIAHCQREPPTFELSCNITTPQKNSNVSSKNIRSISAINRCAKGYQNLDIIKRCENLIDSNPFEGDFMLYKPVTNNFENITYWNKYCAICNNEIKLQYWPTWYMLNNLRFVCKIVESGILTGSPGDDLHEMTQTFISKGLKLISRANSSTELQCSMKENWPINMLNFIIPCLTEQFRNKQQNRLNSCQYFKKNGTICLRMRLIIEGMDFVQGENGQINIFDESLNTQFYHGGYTIETGVDNVVYLCEKNNFSHGIFDWVEIFAIFVSVIFLIFYLFSNFNKRYFQSFPNKIICSYSIGILVMYLLLAFVYLLYPFSCVGYFLVQFSWFFHFFWTMIFSLEFCRLTYCTFRERVVVTGPQPLYLVYCFLGYVIPVALPIIYFVILETDENLCQSIPDHFAIPCKPTKNSIAEYFMETLLYIFDTSLSFLIPVLLVLQASVMIYFTECAPTRIKSTANDNDLIILMKMALIMGAHWMLYVFCSWYGYDHSLTMVSASVFSQLLIDFQGVFVFLAFGLKRRMFDGILYKCENKERSSEQGTDAEAEKIMHLQPLSVPINDSMEKTE